MDFIRDSVYPEITLKSQNYSIRPVIPMSYPKSTQNKSPEKNRSQRGSFTTNGSESVKILKDTSEPQTPKDPSEDQISSKGPPGTDQRSMGEQLPTPVVHHIALERSPDSI
jgi:hypothetical protein